MGTTAWVVLGLVAWVLVGIPFALLLGRMIRLRDNPPPSDHDRSETTDPTPRRVTSAGGTTSSPREGTSSRAQRASAAPRAPTSTRPDD